MRLFLATLLGDSPLTKAVAEYQSRLAAQGWRGTAVPGSALHLTYVFLGDVDAPTARRLEEAIDRLAEWPPVRWRIERVGWFGAQSMPRVVWAGSRQEPLGLVRLACGTRALVRAAGWQGPLGPWSPHVTLFRVKRPGPVAPPPWRRPIWLTVRTVALIQSTLHPSGPVYEPIATVVLRRASE